MKKEFFLKIIVVVITLIGTVIALFTAYTSYQTEIIRQHAELTRISLLVPATQMQTSSVSTISALSTPDTPSHPPTIYPTNTYAPPTFTLTPTLLPTQTPDLRLFWDDFSSLPKSDWHMEGINFSVVDHKLVAENGSFAGYIGNSSWTNYAVVLKNISIPILSTGFPGRYIDIPIRMVDMNNAILFRAWLAWAGSGNSGFTWLIMQNGETLEIPGTNGVFNAHSNPIIIRLEANGPEYSTIINGSLVKSFANDAFTSGGTGIRAVDFIFSLDEFYVVSLP